MFKVCQYIFTISLLSPLGKGHGHSFEQTRFPITQRCFVPSLEEMGPVVLKKIVHSLLPHYLPLKKKWGHSFERTCDS